MIVARQTLFIFTVVVLKRNTTSKQNGHGCAYPWPFYVQKKKSHGQPKLSRDPIISVPRSPRLRNPSNVSTRNDGSPWNKKGHRANAPVTRVSLVVQSRDGFMRPQAEVCRDNSMLRCPVSGIDGSVLPRTYLLSVSNDLKD
jgi:hypothetical protein